MPQKIRVEFELDINDVMAMMQSGKSKTAKLSTDQVATMAKAGALRASDILSKADATQLSTTIAKIKLTPQIVPQLAKLSNQQLAKMSNLQQNKVKIKMVTPAMNVGPNNPAIVAGGGKGKVSRKS